MNTGHLFAGAGGGKYSPDQEFCSGAIAGFAGFNSDKVALI